MTELDQPRVDWKSFDASATYKCFMLWYTNWLAVCCCIIHQHQKPHQLIYHLYSEWLLWTHAPYTLKLCTIYLSLCLFLTLVEWSMVTRFLRSWVLLSHLDSCSSVSLSSTITGRRPRINYMYVCNVAKWERVTNVLDTINQWSRCKIQGGPPSSYSLQRQTRHWSRDRVHPPDSHGPTIS